MPVTGKEAIERLLPFVGHGEYRLGGGSNPADSDPFDDYNSCDCSAAVLWAFKQARHDKGFPEYEGDINVDSALMDAGLIPGGKGRRLYFKPITWTEAEPGDLLMFPSIRASEVGDTSIPAQRRIRIGHVGFIYRNEPGNLQILQCSSGNPAIKLGRDTVFMSWNQRRTHVWKGKTFANDRWQTRVVRYIGPSSVR